MLLLLFCFNSKPAPAQRKDRKKVNRQWDMAGNSKDLETLDFSGSSEEQKEQRQKEDDEEFENMVKVTLNTYVNTLLIMVELEL